MKFSGNQFVTGRNSTSGMTLVETMCGVAISTVIGAGILSLWLFGGRSFSAMGNYTDLDAKSRYALDTISREVREATAVVGFQNTSAESWLELTNAFEGTTVVYRWDAATRTLFCERPGRTDEPLLTGCDRWEFMLHQRTPQANGTYAFFPATNGPGVYDPSRCKLINMAWKCSRRVLGDQMNTESVQTAQVVLRNKQ